jgi:hypothetical protein
MWLIYLLQRNEYSNLKLAEATIGRGVGSSKRSGRHKPMWVATHMHVEAMIGISLYSYLYLKLAKLYVFLIVFYVFSSTKLKNKRAE